MEKDFVNDERIARVDFNFSRTFCFRQISELDKGIDTVFAMDWVIAVRCTIEFQKSVILAYW